MKKVVGKKQSDAGVVRVHLPWIEQQIANGVRHEAIVEHFAGICFPMNVISFRTSLVRARAKAKEAEKKAREAAEAAGVRYEPPQAAVANQPALQANQGQPENNADSDKSADQTPENKNMENVPELYIPKRPPPMETRNADTVTPEEYQKMLGRKTKP